jgi:hypothetical protein
MNVVPFIRPAGPAPAGAVLGVRRDLMTGAAAACVVRASAPTVDALLGARAAWRARGQSSPISFAPSPEAYGDAASAGNFAATLLAAGFSPRELDIEVEEHALAGLGLDGVERLRARGFGVALAADPLCPLPFGQRTRSLFTEILIAAPARLDPFIGVDPGDLRPIARRLFAARAQGIAVTALGVGDAGWARALAAAGFDRGEGAWADQA